MTSFGIALPQIAEPGGTLPDLAAFATRAEVLGFDTAWVSELTSGPVLDPLAVLAYVAARTETVRIGVAVVLVPLRIPLQLAQSLATIDVLCAGRLTIGVGYGSRPDIYPRFGLTSDRRLQRYVDALDLLHELWTRREVDHDSEWWHLSGPSNVVRPVQLPHPPIWFGARAEPGLRRATRRGEGWIASGSADWEELTRSIDTVQDQLRADGRDRSTFTIAKRVYVAVTEHSTNAEGRMRRWFGSMYNNPELADRVAVVGDAAYCAEHLQRVVDLGVDHILLNPVFDEPAQMELLAGDVMPAIRDHVAEPQPPSAPGVPGGSARPG